jgi:predicted ArsR family transcriptional regulator
MAARVLMTMTSADEDALTAKQLSERLGVSPAAVSGALRYLIQIGMVVRQPEPGSRRDRYRLVDDSWYEMSFTKMTIFKVIADYAAEGAAALGGVETRGGARIAQMRDYFLFVQEELPAALTRRAATKAHREPSSDGSWPRGPR